VGDATPAPVKGGGKGPLGGKRKEAVGDAALIDDLFHAAQRNTLRDTTTAATKDAPRHLRKRHTADAGDDDDATTTTTTKDVTPPAKKRRTVAQAPVESKQRAAEVSTGTPTRTRASATVATAQTTPTGAKSTTPRKSADAKSSRGVGKSAAATTTASAFTRTARGKQCTRGGQVHAPTPKP
jgi:hypothetical protein